MYAKVVDEWLHRALWWQEQEDFERILDQQKRLPQLDEFLQQLLDEFKQLVRLSDYRLESLDGGGLLIVGGGVLFISPGPCSKNIFVQEMHCHLCNI